MKLNLATDSNRVMLEMFELASWNGKGLICHILIYSHWSITQK